VGNQINNNIPVVTIIVPMYNVELYIKDCILSLLNQSYDNIEIILVDDCSIDNTKKIAEYFYEKYPLKIKVIHNQKNIGTYKSINRGIINSSGEYITIIGSDDQFTINKVKDQVNILKKYLKYVACFCKYKRIHYKTNKVLVKDVGESTIMFRRKIIEKIGYYDSVRFGADSEYRDRIRAVYGKKAMYITNDVLYLALFRPNSLISSGKSIQGSIFRIQYRENYSKWHRYCRKLYMEYPLLKRKFNVSNELL
jgi:glycosyltransferase involved in cell wall biosynthesis